MSDAQTNSIQLLLVNNQPGCRRIFRDLLKNARGCEMLGEVESLNEMLESGLFHQADVILLNLDHQDADVLDRIPKVRGEITAKKAVKMIIVSKAKSEENVLKAFRCGANGYILLGEDMESYLSMILGMENDDFILTPKLTKFFLSNVDRLSASFERNTQLSISLLTERERDVFFGICNGETNRTIAVNLVIAENTVRIHVQNILRKLNLKNRQEIIQHYKQWIQDQS